MPTPTPQPGSLIGGKYRVERLLGEGGMGAVFSAVHAISGKRVAIKWMHPEVAEHPDARQRFLREAQASARVRHPNVVDVYDVLEEGDGLFLVMEFLEGEPLSDLMQREHTPLTQLISLLISAMRGVSAAHRQGIVHRDIKPDNIFLARIGDDARPVPKVLDFGISKLTDATDAAITKTGMALGTPLYMSVEQLSGVKDIDARTDIYAFGVILYQAVTGQPPFDAETFPVLIAKIMTEQAVSPKTIRPDIPTTLSRLIEWAMAKNRNERISTIDELIRELEPFASVSDFRAQMTIGGSDIPHISTPSSRPASAAPRSPQPNAQPAQSTPPAAVSNPPPSAPPYASPFALTELVPRASGVPALDGTDSRPEIPRTAGLPMAFGALALVATLALATWWFTRQPAAEADLSPEPHVVVPATAPQPTPTVEAPAPVVAAPMASAPVAPASATNPTPSAAPVVTPSAATPMEPPPATTSRPSTRRHKQASAPLRIDAPTPAVTATVATPSAPPAAPAPSTRPASSTRFRAGALSSDDFE